MKADILKTGVENIFALIKATAGNEATIVSATTVTLGAATAGTGLPGNHNTTIVVTAIDDAGLLNGSSATIDYKRTSLVENVVSPDLDYTVTNDETTAGLLATVAAALGLRQEDVEFTGELTRPGSGTSSQMTLQAKATSYLYVGTQVLEITWPAEPPQTVDAALPTKSLTGFDAAS